MAKLINDALAKGSYNGIPVDDRSQVTVFTSAVLVEKEADKLLWLEDDLTYTIKVSNPDPEETGTPVTIATLTDTIDPAIAQLILGTVFNGNDELTPADDPENPVVGEYVYDPDTGLLTVPLGDVLAGEEPIEISFQVRKV